MDVDFGIEYRPCHRNGCLRDPVTGFWHQYHRIGPHHWHRRRDFAGASTVSRRLVRQPRKSGGKNRGVCNFDAAVFVGFTAVRVMSWISGRDPLQLHARDRRTFWLPCDTQQRKSRHVHSMFVTEPLLAQGRFSWLSLVILGLVLLISGELILRAFGFGNAVLYTPDDMAGFFPAANQDVYRLGGRVITNEFGMRAPPYAREKPAGVFRILMLGDSTLYGGQYVHQNELYARLLEKNLGQVRPNQEVQVLNMGVNGWGPFNKLGFVEKFGTFGADVCVISLPVDDFRRPKIHMWDTPYFRASAPPRLAYEEVLYHLNWRRRSRSQRMSPDEKAQQIKLGMAAYLDLIKLLREAGCEVLIEVLPSRTAGTTNTVPAAEQQLWERFQIEMQKMGLEARFPVGLFAGKGDEEELYHDSMHLQVLGHKIYADHLVESVLNSATWQTRSEQIPAEQTPTRAESTEETQ